MKWNAWNKNWALGIKLLSYFKNYKWSGWLMLRSFSMKIDQQLIFYYVQTTLQFRGSKQSSHSEGGRLLPRLISQSTVCLLWSRWGCLWARGEDVHTPVLWFPSAPPGSCLLCRASVDCTWVAGVLCLPFGRTDETQAPLSLRRGKRRLAAFRGGSFESKLIFYGSFGEVRFGFC